MAPPFSVLLDCGDVTIDPTAAGGEKQALVTMNMCLYTCSTLKMASGGRVVGEELDAFANEGFVLCGKAETIKKMKGEISLCCAEISGSSLTM
jgi:hypothetical protein